MRGRFGGAPRWPTRLTIVAIAFALVLAGCGKGTGYRYVKSSDSTAFLKVPAAWKAFSTRDLVLAEAQVNEQAGKPQSIDDLRMNLALNWRVGFDSSPAPSAINVVQSFNDKLVVDVRVRSLTADERSTMSIDVLRNVELPIDTLKQQQEDADKGKPPDLAINKDFNLRVNQELVRPGGYHGLQTISDLRAPAPDSRVYVFNTVALLDAANTKLYLLNIHCETLCYEQNRSTVLQIIKSFTLQAHRK